LTGELLSIVEAEANAERQLKHVQEERDSMLQQAKAERERKLSSLRIPQVRQPNRQEVRADLSSIKKIAQKNMKTAVKKIVEDVYAEA